MNLEIITWLKDGRQRTAILKVLSNESYLPSEIANKLSLNRASVSRILRQLKEKELVDIVTGGGRTRSYFLTKNGLTCLRQLKRSQ